MKELKIKNINKKLNMHEVADLYNEYYTVIHATRLSSRGTKEDIYLVDNGWRYDLVGGSTHNYISCTKKGFGGHGVLKIKTICKLKITGSSGFISCNTKYGASGSTISGRNREEIKQSLIMETTNIMGINEIIKLPIWQLVSIETV